MSIILIRKRPHILYKKVQNSYEYMNILNFKLFWKPVLEESLKVLEKIVEQEKQNGDVETLTWSQSVTYIKDFKLVGCIEDTPIVYPDIKTDYNDERLSKAFVEIPFCNMFHLDLLKNFVLIKNYKMCRLVLADPITGRLGFHRPEDSEKAYSERYDTVHWESNYDREVYILYSDYIKNKKRLIGKVNTTKVYFKK